MDEIKQTYLIHFLEVFRDKTFQFIDIMPEVDEIYPHDHLGLEQRFTAEPLKEEGVAKAQTYGHCCWCNPELIYTDDLRDNEVWLHKRIQ